MNGTNEHNYTTYYMIQKHVYLYFLLLLSVCSYHVHINTHIQSCSLPNISYMLPTLMGIQSVNIQRGMKYSVKEVATHTLAKKRFIIQNRGQCCVYIHTGCIHLCYLSIYMQITLTELNIILHIHKYYRYCMIQDKPQFCGLNPQTSSQSKHKYPETNGADGTLSTNSSQKKTSNHRMLTKHVLNRWRVSSNRLLPSGKLT